METQVIIYILMCHSFLCEIEKYVIYKTYVNKNEGFYNANNILFQVYLIKSRTEHQIQQNIVL